MMSQTDLSRPQGFRASEYSFHAGGVVRSSKWRPPSRAGPKAAPKRIDGSGIESFLLRKIWKNRRKATGSHGLPRTRRSSEKHIMPSCGRNDERTHQSLITAKIAICFPAFIQIEPQGGRPWRDLLFLSNWQISL
ncbi:MAG: hypothetical protein BWX44_00537 [Spirochaetes bacterium ADurb.Bin001]|nr:MAG: hypothetical protein BWX44_00537 [Spirochaetes bacterium ADurb.Bin001]